MNVGLLGGSDYAWQPEPREKWMDDAACANTDPEMFFPEKGGSTREAKKVCGGCEVRDQCLEYALRRDERFGIWGGLSERDRRKLRPGYVPLPDPVVRPAAATRTPRWKWTEEADQQLRDLRAQNKSDVAIAGVLGISHPTVAKRRHQLELPALPAWGKAKRNEEVVEQVEGEEVVVVEESKRRGGRKPSPHGTDNRYKNGPCRDEATCPGGEGGKTCTAAHREALAAARKGGAPVRTSEEIPTPQTDADRLAATIAAQAEDPASTEGVEEVMVGDDHGFLAPAFPVDPNDLQPEAYPGWAAEREAAAEFMPPKPATDPAVAVDAPRLTGDDPASTPGVVSPDNVERMPEFVALMAPVPGELEFVQVRGMLGGFALALDPSEPWARTLGTAEYAEVIRFGIHDDVDEEESAAAVAAHTAEVSLGELRERFGAYNPGSGDRVHGGLLEDLRVTKVRLAEAQRLIDQLERELGAARATIEAVRIAEERAPLEEGTLAGMPVSVHVELGPDGRPTWVTVQVVAA